MGEESKQYIIDFIYRTQDAQKAIDENKRVAAEAEKSMLKLQKTASGQYRNVETGRFVSSTQAFNLGSGYSVAQQQMLANAKKQALMLTYQPQAPKEDLYKQFDQLKAGESKDVADTGKKIGDSFDFLGERGKSAAVALRSLNGAFKLGTITQEQYKNSLDQINKTYGTNAKGLATFGGQLGELTKRAVAVIPIWMALRTTYMALIQAISSGMNFWKEFESAMTEIKIVGKGSEEEYKQLGNAILQLSVTYGVAAGKALEAAKIFAQQGLSIRETIEMTRVSMIASQVLGEDITKVAEDLTSAVRAYNVPMEDSIVIVDKWMNVQKEFAVTARDLAEGMKTAGATAASFGISIDKFNSHLVGIIETTRKSGSQAANALQMIYTRLFTTGREAIQELGKVPVYQNTNGQAVMETTNIFRDASSVIDDLAVSWKTLSEAEKIELAVQIGSRRQATPFIALMENYDRTLKAQVVSLNSAGAALTAYGLKQDTVQVRIQKMQNSWLQLAESVQQTGPWKIAISLLDAMADRLSMIVNYTQWLNKNQLKPFGKERGDLEAEKGRRETLDQLKEMEQKLSTSGQQPQLLEEVRQGIEAIEKTTPRAVDELDRLIAKVKVVEANPEKYRELKEVRERLSSGKSRDGDISREKELADILNNELKIILSTETATKNVQVNEQAIEDTVDKIYEKREQIQKTLEHNAAVLKLKGASEREILNYLISEYSTNIQLKNSEEARAKLTQLRRDLEIEILGKIKEQSDILQNSVSENLSSLLQGKSSYLDFFNNIGDTFGKGTADAVSEGLTTNLFDATGMGQIFGESMMTLKNVLGGKEKGGILGGIESAHSRGGDIVARKILSAYGSVGMGGVAEWTGNPNVVRGPGGALITTTGNAEYADGYGGIDLGRLSISKKASQLKPKKSTAGVGMRAAGVGINSVMTGYSSYQAAGGKGGGGLAMASGIMGGLGAGLMGIGGLAAGAGGMISAGLAAAMTGVGIVLTIGALVATMIASSKKTKQESSQTQVTENRVSSKIEVTNKNLEIINRNLLGLRSDIRTYILPNSAYFSTKNSLDEEFSVMSRRGYQG